MAEKLHVFGHATFSNILLKTADIMHLTHPVLSGAAKTAFGARHDLLGDDVIADLNVVKLGRTFAQSLHNPPIFMARNNRRLYPTGTTISTTPEHIRSAVGFYVSSANTTGFDLHQNLTRPYFWFGNVIMQTVITWAMTKNSLHFF